MVVRWHMIAIFLRFCTAGTAALQIFAPATKAALEVAVQAWKDDADDARSQYGDMNTWNTASITNMAGVFKAFDSFNEPIGSWNTARVKTLVACFHGARNFNQPIGTWNTAQVTSMDYIFRDAGNFSRSIGAWNTAKVTSMHASFLSSWKFNQAIATWNTAHVTKMAYLFSAAGEFNQPIGTWNTARVTSMTSLFRAAVKFNQPIGNWNTAKVFTMYAMFGRSFKFNHWIGRWNTAHVTNIAYLFSYAGEFNQPIGTWNTARVTLMKQAFFNAGEFNQPIGTWNTARVTSMASLFREAVKFNQPIGNWNTASVTNTIRMFDGATCFCQDLSSWQSQPANTCNTKLFTTSMRNSSSIETSTTITDSAATTNTSTTSTYTLTSSSIETSTNITYVPPATTVASTTATSMPAYSSSETSTTITDVSSTTTAASTTTTSMLTSSSSDASTTIDIVATTVAASTTTTVSSVSTAITTVTLTLLQSDTTPNVPTHVEGEIGMTVSNAAQFVREVNLTLVLRQGIAALANVSYKWVTILRVTLNSIAVNISIRRLVAGQPLGVSWRIEIDRAAPESITVTLIVDRFLRKSIQEANEILNNVIEMNSQLLRGNYTARIAWKFVTALTSTIAPLQRSDSGGDNGLSVLIASVLCSVLLGCALLCYSKKALRGGKGKLSLQDVPSKPETQQQFEQVAGDFAQCGLTELLRPPQSISRADGESLLQLARALVPATGRMAELCLAFAVGHRPQDAEGFGPGLFYATAVLKYLHDHGVECFCSLMFLGGIENSDAFCSLLASPTCCKVLIVIQTQALYGSLALLQQIDVAQESHIALFPLRFERDLPSAAEQWPQVLSSDVTLVRMLSRVQAKFDRMNSMPSPPYTVPEEPGVLHDVVVDMRLKLDLAGGVKENESLSVAASSSEITPTPAARVQPTTLGRVTLGAKPSEGTIIEPDTMKSITKIGYTNTLGNRIEFEAGHQTLTQYVDGYKRVLRMLKYQHPLCVCDQDGHAATYPWEMIVKIQAMAEAAGVPNDLPKGTAPEISVTASVSFGDRLESNKQDVTRPGRDENVPPKVNKSASERKQSSRKRRPQRAPAMQRNASTNYITDANREASTSKTSQDGASSTQKSRGNAVVRKTRTCIQRPQTVQNTESTQGAQAQSSGAVTHNRSADRAQIAITVKKNRRHNSRVRNEGGGQSQLVHSGPATQNSIVEAESASASASKSGKGCNLRSEDLLGSQSRHTNTNAATGHRFDAVTLAPISESEKSIGCHSSGNESNCNQSQLSNSFVVTDVLLHGAKSESTGASKNYKRQLQHANARRRKQHNHSNRHAREGQQQ